MRYKCPKCFTVGGDNRPTITTYRCHKCQDGTIMVEEKRFREWDLRHLRMAQMIASWSKDPSTQVGAVIVDPERRPVSWGYNGFPRGIMDSDERLYNRDTKYEIILHGEHNALLFANRDLRGCTLYCTHVPCTRCTVMYIQRHIARIVSIAPQGEYLDRWGKQIELAQELLNEARVHTQWYSI